LRLCAELVNIAGRAVVFCRTMPDAIRVAGELSRIGVPAASVDHRDFGSSRLRARVVTDETALSCERASTGCVIQFDPASSARRYRRRNDLVANAGATVVSFVVPEREPEARRLLAALDLPDVLTAPDVPAARQAMLDGGHAADDNGANAVTGLGHSPIAAARRALVAAPHRAAQAGRAVGRRARGLTRRLPRRIARTARSARTDDLAPGNQDDHEDNGKHD
jgi:hypothetical protein